MDDQHTKRALDDLADLFLTGIEAGGAAPAPRRVAPRQNPLDGPAPIRLRPKLATPPDDATPGPVTEREMLDAVTGPVEPAAEEQPFLRLTGDPPEIETETRNPKLETPVTAPAPVSAMVEAVILGNLPGVSGPWLQQYAQVLANQHGPVAVLHVGGQHIDVELVEPGAAAGRLRPVMEMGREGDRRPALVALLDSLVRAAEHRVSTVLVHVEPALDGTESLRLFAIDDWTLLCGADDASVVAAYRMLKQRAEADVTVSDKRIGLMMMGADQPASVAAAQRIRSTADSFLNTPVELVGWQKQMIPVHARQLGTFENVAQLWPRLCDWFARLEPPALEHVEMPPAAEGDSSPVAAPPTLEPPKPAPRRSAVMDLPTPARREPPRPAPPRAEPAPPRPEPAPVRDQTPPAPPALDPSAIRHPPSAIPVTPALAALIETLPGAVALEARCPHQPDTEIVLDQRGRLNLLHRQTGDVEQSITRLLAARQWAQEHRQLLALTQRQLKLDETATPALHLMTERAELATQLVARLGDQVKLHLLRRVAVGGDAVWVCAPLN